MVVCSQLIGRKIWNLDEFFFVHKGNLNNYFFANAEHRDAIFILAFA